jgi:replication factor C small subunit
MVNDMSERLVDRYRPKSFEEYVNQKQVVEPIKQMLERKQFPHLLLSGPSGSGKTTLAILIAKARFGDLWKMRFHEYNASDEVRMEFVREIIKPMSQSRTEQIIFMDEMDGIPFAVQQAYRRINEKAVNTQFILSVNDESKMIEALKSRHVLFRFRRLSESDVMTKLISVCVGEGIKMKFNEEERDGLMQIVKDVNGDLRKALNEMEKIITARKEINLKNVLALRGTTTIRDAFTQTLKGNFEIGKNLLEDGYINNGYDTDSVVDGFYTAVSEVEDKEVQARLYFELGNLEHKLKTTSRPIVQLVGFLAYVWVAPHLTKNYKLNFNETAIGGVQ